MTLEDFIDAPIYNLTMVLPAQVAASTMVEWSALVANAARIVGLRRLAVRAAIYGYDIADHDPADACWGLHRRRLRWSYIGGSFRPAHALAAERLFNRRGGVKL